MLLQSLKSALQKLADPQKAQTLQHFFKTGKGEYGEGDKFIGVVVPDIREIAEKYYSLFSVLETEKLLHSKIHEERLCALFIFIHEFEKGDENLQKQIYDIYLSNTKYINNWDLIDLSAKKIVGKYLFAKDRSILYKLAKSNNLWERRMAILATFYFIGRKDYKDSLKIAKILLNDKEDLVQKAVGWMLREVGKRCSQKILEDFLKENYKQMPRTMFRYSIERLPENRRKMYLNGIA